jgi:hypothetical protein
MFLSSTFEDLRREREQVIKAILEMGHIPVGMEMFSAADEEQWKVITRQIDQTDYYVVLVAHRYGSIVDGLSYTEKEYDYAVVTGVPVLAFIIEDGAPWPADWVEPDPVKKSSLAAFKAKLRRRPVSFWRTADDLYGRVSIALMKAINTAPRPGWVRTSDVPSNDAIAELTRLSAENASLRKELEAVVKREAADLESARTRTIEALKANKIDVRVWKKGDTDWKKVTTWSLLELFLRLSPELQIEVSTQVASRLLAVVSTGLNGSKLQGPYPIAANTLKVWLADLVTLGLVEPPKRRHSVQDKDEYWSLTEEGRIIYQRLRRARLEAGLPTSPE